MKMNILEKREPVTPINEEEKGPEDVPGRNNYIPKSPKPAAVRSQYRKATLHDSIISGKQLENTTAKCQRSACKCVITVRVSVDTLDCAHITTGGPRQPAMENAPDTFKTPILCKYNCQL
jgi:hypothetical protein